MFYIVEDSLRRLSSYGHPAVFCKLRVQTNACAISVGKGISQQQSLYRLYFYLLSFAGKHNIKTYHKSYMSHYQIFDIHQLCLRTLL